MASGSAQVGAPGAARSVHELPLHRRIQFWAAAALVVLSVVFYLSWGFAYGVWLDNGVYAVAIVLLLFGVAGMWIMVPNPPAPAPPPH
jgi:membrane protein YdbS with pleckstrin-like domain